MNKLKVFVAARRRAWALLALAISLAVLIPNAGAQTSTTGAVAGAVTDPSGAVVPKADIELMNMDTNAAEKQTSNEAGQYGFSNLMPGHYKVTVKASGFRTFLQANLLVEVNRSTNVPVSLEVGTGAEVVEVTATAAVQLQTIDAQIGNTVPTDAILRLPTLQRNATELLNLQPGTVPGGSNLTMRVAGAI